MLMFDFFYKNIKITQKMHLKLSRRYLTVMILSNPIVKQLFYITSAEQNSATL